MTRTIVLLLAFSPALAAAQVDTDSLRNRERTRVEEEQAQAATAAAVFLDHARPVTARLAAVRGLAGFGDRQQIDGGVAIVRDSSEPMVVRTRALQLVGSQAGEDTSFSRRLLATVADSMAPLVLRREAVTQLSFAMFGSFAFHEQHDLFLETFRAAARDSDPQIRREALRALAGQGDRPALNMLEQGLVSPRHAPLPPSEAVQLLGLVDPAPFYETLRRLLRQPPDSATRVATIELLGRDTVSRSVIVRLLQDRQGSPAVRRAALGALAAGDPPGLAKHVLPVAADASAPLDLRLRAIKAVEVTRTSRDPKVVGRHPDEFDRLMERLGQSPQGEIRKAARGYVARTRTPR